MQYGGAPTELLTAEQFAALPDESMDALELVRGRVVREPPPGPEHGSLASRLVVRLGAYVERTGLGIVMTEAGYVVAADPDTVRAPDLSFVSRDRVPAPGTSGTYWRLGPDLAVEILSPSNTASEIQERVLDYLEAGSRMVWGVDPRRRTVTVYRSAREIRIVAAEESLEGEDVLPGFSVGLDELFG